MENKDYTEGKSEFDIRQSKLETLGVMIGRLNFFHYRAKAPSELPGENIPNKNIFKQHMKGILRVLFFEARMFSKNEEVIETIDDKFKLYESNKKISKMELLEDLRLDVSELMQDAGLEIPRKRNVDPESAWKEGL